MLKKLFSKLIGCDEYGNKYYESQCKRWFNKNNRWVKYKNSNNIGNIDIAWYKWIHYISDSVPIKLKQNYEWMVISNITDYDKIHTPFQEKEVQYYRWNSKYHLNK